MKKILSGIIVLCISAAVFAAPRTMEEAAAIAANFSNEQPQMSRMHKAPRKAAEMQLAHQVAKPNSTEPALYVFNNPNGGWVMVSADDNTETIIAYSNEGFFSGQKSNVAFMMDYYAERIDAASQMTDVEKAKRNSMRKAKKTVEPIAPLLGAIEWGQGAPYYNMCPIDPLNGKRCLTGCVATAAAQIMAYWQWPATGEGFTEYDWYSGNGAHGHEAVNFGETTYDWTNILQADYDKINYTQAQADAVALLNYHVGVATHTGYSSAGSSSGTDAMAEGMKHYFRYNRGKYISGHISSSSGEWKSDDWDTTGHWSQLADMYDIELEARRPILMGGGGKGGSNGHEYVCDGRDENRYYHINYGWGDNGDNGYYLLDNMYSSHNGNYQFSYDVDAVLGIYPNHDPIDVSAIALNKHSLSMVTSDTKKLKATITPSEASNDGKYWLSSNKSVATVDNNGYVTALTPGFATITVVSNNGEYKDSCMVTVTNRTTSSIELNVTKMDVGSYHSSDNSYDLNIYDHSNGDYPWIEVFRFPGTNNIIWGATGTLIAGNNNIRIWLTSSSAYYAKSGWMNIKCVGTSGPKYGHRQYEITAELVGEDGNDYSINSIVETSADYMENEVGDGTPDMPVVTFKSMGEVYHTTLAANNSLSIPANKPLSCNELEFVGWTKVADYDDAAMPELAQEGDVVTENTTYYAVFGTLDSTNPDTEVASVVFKTDGSDHGTYYDPNYNNNGSTAINKIIESSNNMTVIDGQYLRQGAKGLRIGGSDTRNKREKDSGGWWKQGFVLFEFTNQITFTKMEINCSQYGDDQGLLQVDYNNTPHNKRDLSYAYDENLVIVPSKPVTLDSLSVATTNKSAYVKSVKLYKPNFEYYSTSVCPLHNINVISAAHGTVETDLTLANAEDYVNITVTPDANYDLVEIIVMDANNNPVDVRNNMFFMPASDVTVSAVFKSKTATAIDKVATGVDAQKAIENGQIIIIRDNEKYSVLGQKLQ